MEKKTPDKKVVVKKNLTKTDIHKDLMIKALTKSLGVVTAACNNAKISRETHYEWVRTDAGYKQRVEDISEVAIDFVESKLFSGINNGDAGLTRFYLATKGKKRGYIEKTEVAHTIKKLGKDLEDETYED